MDLKHETVYLNSDQNSSIVLLGKKKSSFSLKLKYFLWIVVVMTIVSIMDTIFDLDKSITFPVQNIIKIPVQSEYELPKVKLDKKYMIDQPGCRIAFMKPYDSSIIEYVGPPDKLECSEKYEIFSKKFDSNRITIDMEILKAHNYSINDIDCYYREFRRRTPVTDETDDQIEIVGELIPFEKTEDTIETPQITEKEFVQVLCNNSDGIIFHKDYYHFIPTKKVESKKTLFNDSKDYLNIYITGIDAVSRMNLHRQLPKTVGYALSELEAVEMIGYNKIGDNTFPNLMVLLTGQTGDEIEQGCIAKSKYQRFDDCPLIWKDYNQMSYVTAFAEDATSMGLFNYVKKGFANLTTDYDYRAFDGFANDEIGNTNPGNANLCLGKRVRANVFLSYQREFVKTFQNQPYFGLFWSVSMSHDYLNSPALLDDYYFNFFKYLKINSLINRTAVIFMSDHGLRWGDIRSTYQGRIEERLPFLFFIMPEWFRQKYSLAWHNLQTNTKRLTTPFDLHETLVDLKNLDSITNEKIQERTHLLPNQTMNRGISLFLPIYPERTCKLAHIDQHWCTCQQFKEIDIKTPIVRNITEFLVNEINSQLEGYRGCAKLKLDKIQSASIADVAHLNNEDEKEAVIEEYTVIFITSPGGGSFEATVQKINNEGIPFKLSGTISRINLYGEQSRCITDFHLKLYCFCT